MRLLPRILPVVLCVVALLPRAAAVDAAVPAGGVAVAPVDGRVTSEFRPPASRFGVGHRGVDLEAHSGEPVRAVLGGTVVFAGEVAHVGWITVNHGGGLETTYGPISPAAVRAGDIVPTGTLIGFVAAGATHLDWGAKLDGAYIDPLGLLGRWETFLAPEGDLAEFPPLGGVAAAAPAPAGRLLRPTAGPLTSGFGPRTHPVTGEHRHHDGVDIGAPEGTPVRAAAAGTVTFAGDIAGYGRTVVVDHGAGLTTLYAHQASTAVATRQHVERGALLGRVGATGTATGPHLHFEVRVEGAPQDPRPWLTP